ncbi:DnaJ-domain-containing protein [Hypomontagnella monticulosa]|nr:DnaJ-domain-containing protein [Hypomontagnella monticulosa]
MARPKFPKRDLYKNLTVETTASPEDIKNAFRTLARLTKARDGITNDEVREAREAHEILSDDVLRREYDASRMSDGENVDDGRRRNDKGERAQGSWSRGGTYESRPNRHATPYYEEWEPHSPRPNDQPRSQRVQTEDRIIAMRIRVDMRTVSRELDLLKADFKKVAKMFQQFKFSETEVRYWGELVDDVLDALEEAEDLYDDLHFAVKAAEDGKGSPTAAARLPQHLGTLQAHITRMKYAAMGALLVTEFLSNIQSFQTEDELFSDLEVKLKILGQPLLSQPRRRA